MTEETTPRQVLYAVVSAGFVLVVIVLTIGGAAAGVVPQWWSAILALVIAVVISWIGSNWRRTAWVLGVAIGLFVFWMIGTLVVAA